MNKPTNQTTNQATTQKVRRRAFLKGAIVAGTALGTATTRTLADATTEKAEAEKPLENKGYRETEHVREYYRAARF